MKTLKTSVEVIATKERVWRMLTEQPYLDVWTSALMPDSQVVGTVALDEQLIYQDKTGMGVVAVVSELIPNELLKITVIGEACNGKPDLDNPDSAQWNGAYDKYEISEKDNKTMFSMESVFPTILYEHFAEGWGKMSEKIKELAEKEG